MYSNHVRSVLLQGKLKFYAKVTKFCIPEKAQLFVLLVLNCFALIHSAAMTYGKGARRHRNPIALPVESLLRLTFGPSDFTRHCLCISAPVFVITIAGNVLALFKTKADFFFNIWDFEYLNTWDFEYSTQYQIVCKKQTPTTPGLCKNAASRIFESTRNSTPVNFYGRSCFVLSQAQNLLNLELPILSGNNFLGLW